MTEPSGTGEERCAHVSFSLWVQLIDATRILNRGRGANPVMRRYRRLSPAQSNELWERWKQGEGMNAIGRAFDRTSSSVFNHISYRGGIKPAPRRRSRLALTLAEREEISRGLVAGRSLRTIAQAMGRAPSTLSREIARNGGPDRYRAVRAEAHAWKRAFRPKACKLARHAQLRNAVAVKLALEWSPQQIAGWLKRMHPDNEALRVSHETIYRSLYVQARGVLKKELLAHLRTRRAIRRARNSTMKGKHLGQIVGAVSIAERPASVEDRAVPGHWEGDLLCGAKNSFIVTLVERHSRYVMLAKVANRETQTVVDALIKQARKLPDELYKSLTWDRGKELADHRRFTMETDIAVYFCDPQSPWQRGSNENTNRLLRQYFPKGTDLAPHSQAELSRIARRLNERPRKTLDFQSPAERFSECVASTY
jgi:IS30 family transposase